MWSNQFFLYFLTVLTYVNCESNETNKNVSISSTKIYPNDTHHLHIRFIEWQSITEPDDTVYSKYPEPERLKTSASSNDTITTTITTQNDTLLTRALEKTTSTTSLPDTSTTSTSTTTMSNKARGMCKNYKPPEKPVNILEMADIWQILYYRVQGKLQCFRIHIRKISEEERSSYKTNYGTFDDKVNWTNVVLEVRAMTHVHKKRHFLQGNDEDDGVMTNIVIIYDKEHYRYVFQEESADQWLVYGNLLLMRDCDSGGIVVFSKVPHLPLQQDISEALRGFSEEFKDGKYACDDEKSVMRYYEEDDTDL